MEVRGRTVLVVDDDASIRFLCRVNLELDGWVVRDAATLDGATPDDVIPKPFRLEHLVETIERLAG